MSTTVNMSLELPVPTTTPGPEWASELNAALEVVDAHDHTPGKGVPVPTNGLAIDADLPFNSNKATELKSTQYDSQSTPLSGVGEANSLQYVNGDLWSVNSSGVAFPITSGTSVVAPSSSNTPAGIVLPYAGSSAPAGYLLADGTAVSRTTYAVLFGVIGTTFGIGDGSTTFNLPNPAGRTIMGVGTYTDSVSGSITRTLGQVIGAEKHVITNSELAAHNHGGGDHRHQNFVNQAGSNPLSNANNSPTQRRLLGDAADYGITEVSTTPSTTYIGDGSLSGAIISSAGADAAHNNMQPSLGLNYIIKT